MNNLRDRLFLDVCRGDREGQERQEVIVRIFQKENVPEVNPQGRRTDKDDESIDGSI